MKEFLKKCIGLLIVGLILALGTVTSMAIAIPHHRVRGGDAAEHIP